MSFRPTLFQRMGPGFVRAFGNVDCEFVIAGAARPTVRGILRQWRETDLASEGMQAVEGTTHLLSVAALDAPGLRSQRDSVTVFVTGAGGVRLDAGQTFGVASHEDDGRAMLKIQLSGDI